MGLYVLIHRVTVRGPIRGPEMGPNRGISPGIGLGVYYGVFLYRNHDTKTAQETGTFNGTING